MTHPDFRALCAELLQELCCHYRSWELKEGYCSDAMTRADAALSAASSRPPTHCTPVQLRPVNRYTLSDAILAAWHKHGNDSWCSIADEVIAALAAPQQGAPSDEDLDHIFVSNIRPRRRKSDDPEWLDHVEFRKAARAVLARYGAQTVAAAPPSGYAYRYPTVDGTVIRFNQGQEVNGSKPLYAVPYWFAPPHSVPLP